MQQHGDHASVNINILEWIARPRTYTKGQNLPFHIKAVKRFLKTVKAPEEYHLAILVNSFDEECQLELFAHPEYQEEDADFEAVCALLLRVFDARKAGLSRLVRLLEIKQGAEETCCQFLARLRVEGYKMFGDEDKEQNERFITSAFINGLRNKAIAKAIETLDTNSSEAALKLAKKAEEQFQRETTVDCYEMSQEKSKRPYSQREDFEDMKKQIQFLTEQVMYLSNKLKFQNNRFYNGQTTRRSQTYAGAVRNGPQYQGQQSRPMVTTGNNSQSFRPRAPRDNNWNSNKTSTVRCWNCDGTHLLRSCPKKLICKACNRVGHVSRFCDSSNIRYIHEEPLSEQFEANDAEEDFEESSMNSWERTAGDPGSFSDDNASPAILTVQVGDEDCMPRVRNVLRKPKPRKEKCRRRDENAEEIDGWIRYIEGQTSQMPAACSDPVISVPKQLRRKAEAERYTPTVISYSRAEGAANKPLVMGKCGNFSTPVLIDSGAALNVIDESFVLSLPADAIIRRDFRETRIRCANDEIVRSKGRVTLTVKIGSRSENMVFSIMPRVFPKVIIGLRQMKHSRMVIDPPEDSLWIENERIKFISKTEDLEKINM